MAASAAFILSTLDEAEYHARKHNTSLDLSIDTRNSLLDTSAETSLNTSLDSFYTNNTEETDHTLKVTNVSRMKASKSKRGFNDDTMRISDSPIEVFANKLRYRIENEKKIMMMKAKMQHRKYQGFSEALRNSFQCGCTSTVDDDDSYDS